MRHALILLLLVGCGAPSAHELATPAPIEPVITSTSDLVDDEGSAPPIIHSIVPPSHAEYLLGPASSAQIDDGARWVESFDLELRAGSIVRLNAESASLDTTLRLSDAQGRDWLFNDDGIDTGTNARLQFSPPVDGTYRLDVSSYAPGETGMFALTVAELDPTKLGVVIEATGLADARIVAGGGGPGDSRAVASFFFDAEIGERITVDAMSGDLDPVATLYFPNGQTATNDDGGVVDDDMSELDSRLSFVAPVTGTYHLAVHDYNGAIGGGITARLAVEPPIYVDDDGTAPEAGFAGPGTEGRVLGLFAGISDYIDSGDLYGCAADAQLLGEAFDSRALTDADDRLVITDHQVTLAGFAKGLQALAERATADDVVVIFFSGHGSRVETEEDDTEELDGLDDTIVLRDGEMTDDEMMALIDEIDAGLIILAIDACQSGGFARDFVDRPGRIGIFSSDEDILSDTAEVWQAGGYVSWYLRRAIAGLADARPHDGSLSAGELADFLVAGFDESRDFMSPPGSTSPMQRLVIDRGSVQWGDLLWVYPRLRDGSLPLSPIAADVAPPSGPAVISSPAVCE